MTIPHTWKDLLSAPAFIIHLERHTSRVEKCVSRTHAAGYTNVQLFPAVDGQVLEEWSRHPVTYDGSSLIPKAAGCLLSHLNVWKKIMDENIPYATVFEDDILFHTKWHQLASSYYDATPKHADMIYMGHHCGNVVPNVHVLRVPVYCTNAYIVTVDGARKLYEMITQYPYHDYLHAIDMMLVRLMSEQLHVQQHNKNHKNTGENLLPLRFPILEWYVWNSEMFPDEDTMPLIHPDLVHKDKGLVFQEWMHGFKDTITETERQ